MYVHKPGILSSLTFSYFTLKRLKQYIRPLFLRSPVLAVSYSPHRDLQLNHFRLQQLWPAGHNARYRDISQQFIS